MQTFLPYPDLQASAQCLDNKRLANQVNEALVILRTLLGYYGSGKGWPNHPAVKMWKGYEAFLYQYRATCIEECERRGIKRNFAEAPIIVGDIVVPPWFGGSIHESHQAALYQKDPVYYQQFANVKQQPYVWPTTEKENKMKNYYDLANEFMNKVIPTLWRHADEWKHHPQRESFVTNFASAWCSTLYHMSEDRQECVEFVDKVIQELEAYKEWHK
jgi:hypothetical protein